MCLFVGNNISQSICMYMYVCMYVCMLLPSGIQLVEVYSGAQTFLHMGIYYVSI
jgi:hypothetical protein